MLSSNVSSEFPFVLLPVQLQVKFHQPPVGGFELLVRIYPDRFDVNTFEGALTASEIEAGKTYWREATKRPVPATSTDRGLHWLPAWRTLVSQYGSNRAAWIVERTTPGNVAALATALQQGATVPEPTFFVTPAHKPHAWATPALARSLPTRYVGTLYTVFESEDEVRDFNRENLYIQQQFLDLPKRQTTKHPEPPGMPYPEYLLDPTTEFLQLFRSPVEGKLVVGEDRWEDAVPVGPDPAGTVDPEADESLRWLHDFAEAERRGLALRFTDLTLDDVKKGFARLVVLGVRDTESPEVGAETLATVLSGHRYSSGLSLLPQGTPTNNTGSQGSGYDSASDYDADRSFAVKLGEPLVGPDEAPLAQPDGQRLATWLGVPRTALDRVEGADAHQLRPAQLMNRALWPATFGYFLEETLQTYGAPNQSVDPLFSDEDLEWTRRFFETYVSGPGPAPAMRIGDEPYGVLPVTRYSSWRNSSGNDSRADTLWDLLRRLDGTWTERLNQTGEYRPVQNGDFYVPFAPEPPSRQNFLQVLGLEAASTGYYQRYYLGPAGMQIIGGMSVFNGRNPWPRIERGPYDDSRDQRPNAPLYADRGAPENLLWNNFLDTLYPENPKPVPLTSADWPVLFEQVYQHTYAHIAQVYADLPPARDPDNGAVVEERALSETEPLAKLGDAGINYIEWLATAPFPEIYQESFASVGDLGENYPNSLLYRLLRRAVLLKYWWAGARLLQLDAAQRREYDFFDATGTDRARWDVLLKGNDDLTQGQPVYEWLLSEDGQQHPEAQELALYLSDLQELAQVPTAQLERSLAEHLDMGSYRLDAWETAFVTQRLERMRQSNPEGAFLGNFGWLENLKPSADSLIVPQPADLRDDPDNLGYVHAPSPTHGITAAVLRQGFKSRQFSADPDDPTADRMAVNLSSERVRRALNVLEGVRTGQALPVQLGQEFEAALEASPQTAPYVPVFRAKCPFADEKASIGGDGPAAGTSLERAQRQVVDGLALLGYLRGKTYPYGLPTGSGGLPVAPSAAAQAVAGVVQRSLNALADTLDALGDLAVSESVHQVVSGNVEQASALLDSVAKGNFPVSPDVVHPQRSGTSLTHRVLVHLPWAGDATIWNDKPTPRSAVQPELNQWLAEMFGPAERYQVAYRYQAPGVLPEDAVPDAITIDKLGLEPVDLLALLDAEASQPGSAFAQYVAYAVQQQRRVNNTDGIVTVQVEASALALRPLYLLVGRLRALLANARPATAVDFDAPSLMQPGIAATEADFDRDEITKRLKLAAEALLEQANELAAAADALPDLVEALTPELLQVRDVLYGLRGYGSPEVRFALQAEPATARPATQRAVAALTVRAEAAMNALGTANLNAAQVVTASQHLFGPDFRLAVGTTLVGERAKQYKDATEPDQVTRLLRYHEQHPDRAVPREALLQEWLQGAAAVREPVQHLAAAVAVRELLLAGAPVRLEPAQLSAQAEPNDYWLGVEYPPREADSKPLADAVSLVQWLPDDYAYQDDQPQWAFWVDEWQEVIPDEYQTTSLVFHYDQPNTEAPQCVLVVVPPVSPDEQGFWTWEDLLGAVHESLDLAKKRAVEPDSLVFTHLGTVLPAIAAPVAQEAVTMTLDFRRIAGNGRSAQFAEMPLEPS